MNSPAVLDDDMGTRRFDLDWVRILAFMLLIFYHVGMYYVTWDWHVKSPAASHAIEPLMMLTSPWRLALLFLVSGVATGYLLKRTRGNFLGSRSVRLLVPLAFGMLVIVPPQSYLEVVEKLQYAGSFGDFYRLYMSGFHGFCRADDCLTLPTWNHLWFVAYLWVYTVLLYAGTRLAPRLVSGVRHAAERRLGTLGMLLMPTAYLVLLRFVLAPYYPQNHALVGDWYSHAMYFAIFALGFVLAGTRAPWQALERSRFITLGLWVLSWGFIAAYVGAYGDDAALPPDWLRYLGRADYGINQWFAIAAILGFARRHLMHDNAARRYLTTAIFPVYILHQSVIVVVAHALKPAHLNPLVEGMLLVMVTGAACFLGFEVIRRVRPLKPLFGLAQDARTPRRAREGAAAPQFCAFRYSDLH
jgi:glucans biosynthesis protein C